MAAQSSTSSCVQVHKAFEYLQKAEDVDKPDRWYDIRVQRTDTTQSWQRGIYLRDPWHSRKNVSFICEVKPNMRRVSLSSLLYLAESKSICSQIREGTRLVRVGRLGSSSRAAGTTQVLMADNVLPSVWSGTEAGEACPLCNRPVAGSCFEAASQKQTTSLSICTRQCLIW